ncbi:TlpA family protein disulfide reductase [Solitalea sp. MAHUQ-68]|uniref:TlpA family protein disulfide reductase n=1 Tax=Solitalea agri TaxID=2953739 RepID=A0A9X2JAE8_9SPHI|nr:TlpA disulfide reductase family protein [Solitalea agri]MCO4291337.1 TlpA family protein disulfide reductase [Solitalea agri]
MRFVVSLLIISSFLLCSCSFSGKQEKDTVLRAANGMPIGNNEGFMAPEIQLADINGNKVDLSSLKGKYVLIDFWASWCQPCIEEIPELKKLYSFYHSKGLEIYGVSLDNDRNRWVKAISDHQMNWVQVSDLKKWQSEPLVSYGVDAIPSNFLLDKEGKIIAKNLHGDQLEDFFKKLFN